MNDGESWIQEHIKRRECCRPVRRANQGETEICLCHRTLENHVPQARKKYSRKEKWSKDKNTKLFVTDAYGIVRSQRGTPIKYVRADEHTKADTIETLLTKVWNLPCPQWIISVIGESTGFASAGIKRVFRSELQDTLQCITASNVVWVITESREGGLRKHVDASVQQTKDETYTSADNTNTEGIVRLGISPWGTLRNKDNFKIKSDEDKELSQTPQRRDTQYCFGEGADYVILVDNGTEDPTSCAVSSQSLWTKLQTKMANFGDECTSVPLVYVLFGGSVDGNSLHCLQMAIDEGIPVIIVQGSGGFADILAEYYNVTRTDRDSFIDIEQKHWSPGLGIPEIKEETIEFDIDNDSDDLKRDLVLHCLRKRYLLTVFNTRDPTHRLFNSVITALLKTKTTKELLHLVDNYASGDDQEYDVYFRKESYSKSLVANMTEVILVEAIMINRLDLVRYLLMEKKFLEDSWVWLDVSLLALYIRTLEDLPEDLQRKLCMLCDKMNEMDKYSILQERMKRGRSSVDIKECAEVLSLLEKYSHDAFTQTYHKEYPVFAERFIERRLIWACLSDKRGAARMFWRMTVNHALTRNLPLKQSIIETALFTSSLLRAVCERTEKLEHKKRLEKHASLFENRASGVLNVAYSRDTESTEHLLNTLRLDITENNQGILTTEAYMHVVDKKWMGAIAKETYTLMIILATFFFPLIFFIRMDQKSDKAPKSRWLRCFCAIQTCFQKIIKFYQTLIVAYIISTTFYIVFLAVYGHLILVELNMDLSPLEAVIAVWVFAIFVEEIVQLARSDPKRAYFDDGWNFLDMSCILLYILGAGLRASSDFAVFEAGRVILCLDHMVFFWRILQICAINKTLGPKLVMISEMISKDLIPFLVILFIFIASYAIASESILFPNSTYSAKFVLLIPQRAFFTIFGEFFLDEIEGDVTDPPCTSNKTLAAMDSRYTRCPSEAGKYLVPVMAAFFIIIANVLLLNMLIAVFNNTFKQHNAKNTELWAWQRYQLTKEYASRSYIPIPLTLLLRFVQSGLALGTVIVNAIELFTDASILDTNSSCCRHTVSPHATGESLLHLSQSDQMIQKTDGNHSESLDSGAGKSTETEALRTNFRQVPGIIPQPSSEDKTLIVSNTHKTDQDNQNNDEENQSDLSDYEPERDDSRSPRPGKNVSFRVSRFVHSEDVKNIHRWMLDMSEVYMETAAIERDLYTDTKYANG